MKNFAADLDRELFRRECVKLGLLQLGAIFLGRLAMGVSVLMSRLDLSAVRPEVEWVRTWWLGLALIPLVWVGFAAWVRLQILDKGHGGGLTILLLSGWTLFLLLAGLMLFLFYRAAYHHWMLL